VGLDSVELVMKVEESYGLAIPDDDAENLTTVEKLRDYVVSALKKKGRTDLDPQTIFYELRTIICRQLALKPEQVRLESRFVQDLYLDKR
jgi:acyl carrier protein